MSITFLGRNMRRVDQGIFWNVLVSIERVTHFTQSKHQHNSLFSLLGLNLEHDKGKVDIYLLISRSAPNCLYVRSCLIALSLYLLCYELLC